MTDATAGPTSETLIFDALSDGVRRQILECLGDRGECSVGELSSYVHSVGRTAVSSHLRVLRTSGVVQERKEGRMRYYSLDPQGTVGAAVQYLQRLLDKGTSDLSDAVAVDVRHQLDSEPPQRLTN